MPPNDEWWIFFILTKEGYQSFIACLRETAIAIGMKQSKNMLRDLIDLTIRAQTPPQAFQTFVFKQGYNSNRTRLSSRRIDGASSYIFVLGGVRKLIYFIHIFKLLKRNGCTVLSFHDLAFRSHAFVFFLFYCIFRGKGLTSVF